MNDFKNHPKLRKYHSTDHPGDLQVLIHNGGPRLTDRKPELIWVKVISEDDAIFEGLILNEPKQLNGIKCGDTIHFLIPDGGRYPLMITEKYIKERSDWIIQPCDNCGLTELFDAPSDLNRVVFPDNPEGAIIAMSTVICGACGGSQVMQYKNVSLPENEKKWWQFWK